MEKKSPLAAVSIGVEYTQNAVIRSLQHKGWIVNGSSSSTDSSAATSGATSVALHWSDFSAIPWDAVLDGSTTASAQYLKTGLVRKADLLHYMTKHGVAHWLPTTISADIEDEEDIDELIAKWSKACDIDASKREAGADAERPLWLLKPSRANRGEGIAVLRSGDESAARSAIARFPRFRDWLLQRYVVPLLLPPSPSVLPMATLRPELRSAACGGDGSGLKCHLRLHVLAVGSLSVWVHDAPLVLLASQPWSNPAHSVISPDGDGDEVDLLAHLTNRCRQARGESYDERAHTRRFREAFGPPLADRLLEQCKSIAAAAFKPFERGSAAFLPLPHCFELYGFDIAIDVGLVPATRGELGATSRYTGLASKRTPMPCCVMCSASWQISCTRASPSEALRPPSRCERTAMQFHQAVRAASLACSASRVRIRALSSTASSAPSPR